MIDSCDTSRCQTKLMRKCTIRRRRRGSRSLQTPGRHSPESGQRTKNDASTTTTAKGPGLVQQRVARQITKAKEERGQLALSRLPTTAHADRPVSAQVAVNTG